MTENLSSGFAVLDEAHQALRVTAEGLSPADLGRPTPCEQWNVTQVLQHAAGDQLAYASRITGGPGPTENPFEPSGRLDQDAAGFIEHALLATADAWRTVAEDDQDVATPLPQGRMSARLGAGACALDAAVHAWDVAMATGQKSPLTDSLARELMTVAQSIVEPLRSYGVFAAAIETSDGDDDVARLLRYLGRQPGWTL
jgi:uncharacterized protein (TIGR03086 family)